jgi:hypothetical protein
LELGEHCAEVDIRIEENMIRKNFWNWENMILILILELREHCAEVDTWNQENAVLK